MKKNSPILIFIFIISCMSACGQQYSSFKEMTDDLYKNTVPLIYAAQLSDSLQAGKNIILLDAREQEEYNVSHLPGALYIGYENINRQLLQRLPKNKIIVVYCSVGVRSERIGEKLLDAGFTNVYNLYGGIFDWINNGYVVYDKQNQPTGKVHPYNEKWGVWLQKGIKAYE